ncbi:hypothetical protein D9M72_278080 [compost metagenome]
MLALESLARDVVRLRNADPAGLNAKLDTLDRLLQTMAQERLDHEDTIQAARSNYAAPSDDDLEVDDEPLLSVGEDGVWVGAWVWIPTGDDS